MPLRIELRRRLYRFAYVMLRVYWFLAGPTVDGVKFILTDGPRVLLVRHTYGPSSWDVPGGTIRRREAPLSAARREAAEELGISIDDWTPLGAITGRMHRRQDTLHCFGIELTNPVLTLDRGELAAARWFPIDRLPPDLGRYVRAILALLP